MSTLDVVQAMFGQGHHRNSPGPVDSPWDTREADAPGHDHQTPAPDYRPDPAPAGQEHYAPGQPPGPEPALESREAPADLIEALQTAVWAVITGPHADHMVAHAATAGQGSSGHADDGMMQQFAGL